MPTDPARVQALFLAAVERPDPAARADYLDRECAGDPALRHRVAALLHAHDQPDSLLDSPVAGADGQTRTLPAGSDPAATRTHGEGADDDLADARSLLAPPGRSDSLGRVGHYEVLAVLGRGGFGIVYRAFDDVLQRVVAVKVLSPAMAATSPARKRFLREARSSAQVRHENVVHVYEIGEQPLPYLVMEFVPGETLQQRLDRSGPLDVPEVLRIGRQIAAGLAAAHEQGLIHRDIKPSNILIGSSPQEPVKITDFGLARAADDASLTRSGAVAGTPMYMAPEQARGEKVDHRADLFSLGSVLYAMLAGRPPFRARTTLAVLKRVTEDDPRPIREVIPEVPDWLCRIVEKLHAKDPAERFERARDVADLLADCEQQVKTHGKLQDFTRVPAGRAPTRRRRRSPVVLAVVVLAVVLGLPALVAVVGAAAWLLMPIQPVGPNRMQGPEVEPVEQVVGLAPPAPPSAPGRTIPGWGTVVDPKGDCKIEGGAEALTITVPAGVHNLNPTPAFNDLSAPRVLRKVSGDFRTEVRVGSVAALPPNSPATSYVGAGLLLWRDERNFVRFVRAATANPRRVFLHLECIRDGRLTASTGLDAPDQTTALRVVRTGDACRFYWSSDGGTWSQYGNGLVNLAGALEVGVCAINTTAAPVTARFTGPEFRSAADVGFVPLFNGKDLAGWKAHPDYPGDWAVRDGALVGGPAPGYLFSEAGNYRNFHLRAEVRVNSGGDSGLFVRTPFAMREGKKADQRRPGGGYEVELHKVPNHAAKTGSVWNAGTQGPPRLLARTADDSLTKADE